MILIVIIVVVIITLRRLAAIRARGAQTPGQESRLSRGPRPGPLLVLVLVLLYRIVLLPVLYRIVRISTITIITFIIVTLIVILIILTIIITITVMQLIIQGRDHEWGLHGAFSGEGPTRPIARAALRTEKSRGAR